MPFRKTIPISELGRSLSPEEIAEHETTYQASRGGYFQPVQKPVPGTPKKSPKGGRS